MREASDSIAIEITAAAQSANSAIGGLQQTLGKYNTAIANGSKNAKNFSNSLATLAIKSTAALYALRKIGNVLGGLFEANGDYIESVNLFRVTMGDAAEEAMKFAQEVERLAGINSQEWMENQGALQQLIIGFGVGADKASIMSRNLTQLAYDISSVYNTSIETAMQKVQSGMAGMVKGLRAYGIETSVAALQEYALANGINQSVSTMSMAEKTLLRYNLIMERSANLHGDLARTIISPSNALRILSSQWDIAKRNMGAIVAVIATQIIPVFQAIVQIISQAAAAIAAFFGYNINDYLADLSGLGSNEWGAGAEDVEDALAGGAGSAKKIKDYMMGFDELNVIKPEEDYGGSGGGGGGGGGGGIKGLKLFDNNKWLDELTEKTKKLTSILKTLMKIALGVVAAFALWKFADLLLKPLGMSLLEVCKSGIGVKGVFELLGLGLKQFRSSISPATKALVGTAGLVASFFSAKKAAYDVTSGTKTLGETLAWFAPVIGVVAAAMWVFLGTTGLIITAIGVVVGVIWGWNKAMDEAAQSAYESTETYLVMSDIAARSATSIQFAADATERLNEGLQAIQNVDVEWGGIHTLIDRIYELNSISGKTPYEFAVMSALVESLNSMNLDGIKLSIDSTTGLIVEQQSAIQGVIDKMLLQAQTAALMDFITQSYKDQYQAAINLNAAFDDLAVATEANSKAQQELDEYKADFDSTYEGLIKTNPEAYALASALMQLTPEYRALEMAVEDTGIQMETAETALTDSMVFFQEAGSHIQIYTDELANLKGAGLDGMAGLTDGITEGGKATTKTMMKQAQDIIDIYQKTQNAHSPSKAYIQQSLYSMQGLAQGITDNAYLVTGAMTALLNTLLGLVEAFANRVASAISDALSSAAAAIASARLVGESMVFSSPSRVSVPRFANGGFPEDGAFFANSGELVGQFSNGRTAVANNDQIVAGIQQGVYAAVISAMSETSGNGDYDFNIYISGKQVEAEVEKVKKGRGATIMSGGLSYSY